MMIKPSCVEHGRIYHLMLLNLKTDKCELSSLFCTNFDTICTISCLTFISTAPYTKYYLVELSIHYIGSGEVWLHNEWRECTSFGFGRGWLDWQVFLDRACKTLRKVPGKGSHSREGRQKPKWPLSPKPQTGLRRTRKHSGGRTIWEVRPLGLRTQPWPKCDLPQPPWAAWWKYEGPPPVVCWALRTTPQVSSPLSVPSSRYVDLNFS